MVRRASKQVGRDRRALCGADGVRSRAVADASETRPYLDLGMAAHSKIPTGAWRRPCSLFQVVREAETTEDIGYNLADFLDHVNFLAKQPGARVRVAASLRTEPVRTGDAVQDAYLAAVAAHLAQRHRVRVPAWTDKKHRRLERPWFALPDDWARAMLLRDSPPAFRERNLFTGEDPLHRA